MKKLSLALLITFSLSSHAENMEEDLVTDYFGDRQEVVSVLNQDIRLFGGLERIDDLAEKNDAKANYLLGQMYRMGIVYDADLDKAVNYFVLSAKNNYKEAAFLLGLMLLGEDHLYPLESYEIEDNQNIGHGWIKIAAEQGLPEAQYFLGNGYLKGEFFVKDVDLALFWLSRAAQQGHEKADYQRKELVFKTKELDKSFDETRMRAANGDKSSLIALADMYYDGYVVQKNYEKAHRLYLQASKLGDKKATKRVRELEDLMGKW